MDDGLNWKPVTPAPALSGEHVATCVGAAVSRSQAGNPMIVWTFDVEGQRLNHYTLRFRAETGLTVQALGLGKRFKLSEVVGRQCRITVAADGQWLKVTAVRPL